MNLKYRATIKEEIQKLLDVIIIYSVEESEWVSPILVTKKKNKKPWICVDFHKLNKVTIKDPFLAHFIEDNLEGVIGRESYSFLDVNSGYAQFSIKEKDKPLMTFSTK